MTSLFVLGVLTVLKRPYPRMVQEPSIYGTVKIHATMGRNKSVVNPKNLSVSTVERPVVGTYARSPPGSIHLTVL